MTPTSWSWPALLLLGAGHGINPGMGWLFAVALGLQHRSGAAVWRALPPLALGHAAAIGAVLLLAAVAGLAVPIHYLQWLVATTLTGFGIYRLVRNRHPRWVGMRVGARELTVWSFLMASAHGAGLMVLPFVIGTASSMGSIQHHHDVPRWDGWRSDGSPVPETAHHPGPAPSHSGHQPDGGVSREVSGTTVQVPLATVAHTLGYLVVTGILALVVYQRLGLRMLRAVWFNLDRVWGAALVATGVLTALM